GFVSIVHGLQDLVAAHDGATAPSAVLQAVLDRSGYLAELSGSDDPQDSTRVDNLRELVSVAHEYEAGAVEEGSTGAVETGADALLGFLEQISLVADADDIPEGEDHEGVITLMTLHTAKGLEFPVVFLTGVEDGVCPHQRALAEEKELEEERRLAYVGITRAEQRLYLTRATTRRAWGAPQHNPASRFLTEIPEELID